MRRNEEQGAEKDDKGDCSPGEMTGGYYWLPALSHPTICWDVVICHQLGFDSEIGPWRCGPPYSIGSPRLGTRTQRSCGDCSKDRCYGLPRGRVTRPRRRYLILHGGDSPRPNWLEPLLVGFRLDRRSVKALFDDHERTLAEDRRRVLKVLGVPAS